MATTDTMLVLRNVAIFSQTPEDILEAITRIVEEVEVRAGDVIFEKGDLGTCMYIIVEGKARVHDEDRTLNYLGKRDVFGEMSVLDPEPRSASVTAVEDTRLFRLEQEDLYRLIIGRAEVARSFIHILIERLRARMRDMADDHRYMQQFARVTAAAAAVEAGIFEPESLDEVALRTDALGQLARVFQRMTREVEAREHRLRLEVQALRIEVDRTKQERQVREITDTDYFRDLHTKVQNLKKRQSS